MKWAEVYYGSQSTELVGLRLIVKRLQASYAVTEADPFGYVKFEAMRRGTRRKD